PEDLRRPFGQFGPLKDIYLPRDYYSGEPRGFGFVQFLGTADAAEAKYQMDCQNYCNKQNVAEAAAAGLMVTGGHHHLVIRAHHLHATLGLLLHAMRSRSNSREYSPPPKTKQHGRSISPGEKRHSRERSYSRSPPPARGRSPPPRSPVVDNSVPEHQGILAVALSRVITLLALESLFHYFVARHLENLMLVDNGNVGALAYNREVIRVAENARPNATRSASAFSTTQFASSQS
ncbi:serine/arginine-rich SC35-like splicing factor SCL30A, partial [Tanacetum coccineum]